MCSLTTGCVTGADKCERFRVGYHCVPSLKLLHVREERTEDGESVWAREGENVGGRERGGKG